MPKHTPERSLTVPEIKQVIEREATKMIAGMRRARDGKAALAAQYEGYNDRDHYSRRIDECWKAVAWLDCEIDGVEKLATRIGLALDYPDHEFTP